VVEPSTSGPVARHLNILGHYHPFSDSRVHYRRIILLGAHRIPGRVGLYHTCSARLSFGREKQRDRLPPRILIHGYKLASHMGIQNLFVTVTIHGSFFIREWVRADFFSIELEMMPMVKYGLGLWGVLAWTMITSFVPLRSLCYKFFVLQHIISAAIFLWLLHTHVPAYAVYNIWTAVAFVLLGRMSRFGLLLYKTSAFGVRY